MATEVVPGYVIELAAFVAMASIFALLSIALNLQWGHTGLFNAGIAAFFALGAYTTAILVTAPEEPIPGVYPGHLGGFSQPFYVAVIAAAVVSGVVGLLIAIPTLRLRADYLAIATLGLGEAIRTYLTNDEPRTGGTYGIYGIPRLFAGMGLTTGQVEVLIALVALLLLGFTVVGLEALGRTPWSRVLKAIREDEDAAELLGKDTFKHKLQSFVIGCAIMGVAGSLFTVFFAFVEPVTSFRPLTTFTVWAMLVLGGSGNHRGAILGAFVFYSFEWIAVRVQLLAGATGTIRVNEVALMAAVALVETGILLVFLAWPRLRDRPVLFLGVSGLILAIEIALFGSLLFVRLPVWIIERLAYIRLMAVGVILILLVLRRPQGVIPERPLTVRRRQAG
ncbi:MAG: hypothetical protein A3K59_03585 [Euryarchaeota archaeon RBG_19FT_COMBO_69_17]|uniref:Hydrophobic amino acid ABC transporter permease n=2 Tax=environmental samples TaxID=68359 RepID=A0A0H4T4R0_9EURY|nr:hydrophobic amino acid ABC transporter permease [uncultured euryarchaeote Rifle_16ft_4_minimus_23719]AKQ02741.1 hydrophobic amino acid ABC transporter permease [uncultured euryarchaeote Rifle_16ft_4_minimus_37664]OGS62114.1 MAG: hypothetical protein A3K59_03585 [Euryarchaeota archaeon RBG_19FT_COMBO_69_17]